MRDPRRLPIAALCLVLGGAPAAQDETMGFHADYYLGFSHGAFYGLMLTGVEYDVAWCVKGELDFEAEKLGTGSEFQAKMESIYVDCLEKN